jgi:hypothetical protein
LTDVALPVQLGADAWVLGLWLIRATSSRPAVPERLPCDVESLVSLLPGRVRQCVRETVETRPALSVRIAPFRPSLLLRQAWRRLC